MKKLMFMLVVLSGVWLASCQKDASSLAPVDESALTASDLESIVSASAARNAVLTDSVTMGKCRGKLTEVAPANLAAAITSYIATTYVGSTIEFAAKDEAGKVIVAVKLADGTFKGLLFNADGTFKEELKQHVKKTKLTKVEPSALPSAITAYITASYVGSVIKHADSNAAGEFLVVIVVDSKIKILLFKADGTFVKELEQPARGPGKKH